MTFQEALFALGVREDTLTQAEKAQLDRDGYLLLHHMFAREQAAAFAARLDELLAIEGDQAGLETHQEEGSDRLSDLVNKDPMFDITFTHPRLLAAVAHAIKADFKFSSLNSRFARPGQGQQGLHADLDEPVMAGPDEFLGCNSMWLLDDFTETNGATRVVPGTHRIRRLPYEEMPDPGAPHPREVKLVAPAGTVIVFNAHTWHSGTRNESSRPRRAMHAFFCRRDQPQQTNQRRYIRPETYARLSEAARYILDVMRDE